METGSPSNFRLTFIYYSHEYWKGICLKQFILFPTKPQFLSLLNEDPYVSPYDSSNQVVVSNLDYLTTSTLTNSTLTSYQFHPPYHSRFRLNLTSVTDPSLPIRTNWLHTHLVIVVSDAPSLVPLRIYCHTDIREVRKTFIIFPTSTQLISLFTWSFRLTRRR